jgi:hypothetical protein
MKTAEAQAYVCGSVKSKNKKSTVSAPSTPFLSGLEANAQHE